MLHNYSYEWKGKAGHQTYSKLTKERVFPFVMGQMGFFSEILTFTQKKDQIKRIKLSHLCYICLFLTAHISHILTLDLFSSLPSLKMEGNTHKHTQTNLSSMVLLQNQLIIFCSVSHLHSWAFCSCTRTGWRGHCPGCLPLWWRSARWPAQWTLHWKKRLVCRRSHSGTSSSSRSHPSPLNPLPRRVQRLSWEYSSVHLNSGNSNDNK